MKKLALLLVVLLLLAGAWVFKFRAAWQELEQDARAHGVPTLAWFEIQRDLRRCGPSVTEMRCVVEGGGGWLFYQESLVNLARPWNDNTPAIIAFKDSLAARGIALVVVPVPDKLQVESSNYLRYSRADLVPAAYRAWVSRLQSAGVSVVDAMDAFLAARDTIPMFEPYESHLTAAGRMRLAHYIADTLAHHLTLPQDRSYTVIDTLCKGSGNLFHMRYGHYRTYRVPETRVVNASGAPYHDNKKAPIVIIGDSNAGHGLQFSSHIGALITQATNLESFTISKVGAGNTGPRVFRGKARFLSTKKAVVWVFDGRELYGNFAMPEF